jgi:hypothetical protein
VGRQTTIPPHQISLRAFAQCLRAVEYFVSVYHQTPPNTPAPPGIFAIDYNGAEYTLIQANDSGFLFGGAEYSVVVLGGVLVFVCCPAEDGDKKTEL